MVVHSAGPMQRALRASTAHAAWMEPWQRVAGVARSQYGLVAVSQAAALGVGPRALQREAERRGAQRVHRGVYALQGVPRSYQRDLMAALLAAGPRSALSHETAAAVVGLHRARPRPIDLVVPMDRKAPQLTGVHARRSRTLTTVDIARTAGLRRTAVARTLCDLATLDEGRLRELAAVALQSRQTTVERITSCSHRLGSHPGAGRLADVLDQLRGTSSDSGFERRARAWLCEEGLPPHPRLYPLRAEDDVLVELDIAYPEARVYVDCVGFPWHSLPSSLVRDALRDNGIAATGWRSLRLTEEQLAVRDPRFLRQLRGLLESGC